MTYRVYCKDCKRKITPKGLPTGLLLAAAILSPMIIPIAGLIVTVICVALLIKGHRCPICNGKNFRELIVKKESAKE